MYKNIHDAEGEEVEPENRARSYAYGSHFVVFGAADEVAAKLANVNGAPSMEFLGTLKQSMLPRTFFMGESSVLAGDSKNPRAQVCGWLARTSPSPVVSHSCVLLGKLTLHISTLFAGGHRGACACDARQRRRRRRRGGGQQQRISGGRRERDEQDEEEAEEAL